MNTPDVKKTLAELTVRSQGADRMAATAGDLAGRLTQERDATMRLITAYVSEERDQAVNQLVDGVSTERKALLKELLAEEQLIEDRLLAKMPAIVDQPGRPAHRLCHAPAGAAGCAGIGRLHRGQPDFSVRRQQIRGVQKSLLN